VHVWRWQQCVSSEKAVCSKIWEFGGQWGQAVKISSRKCHIWNRRPWFAYSLCNFYGATMMMKGSLLLSAPIVYRHSATVLVAFAFQGPPSGTHSHKTYEAVTFPGNSSSVDLRHGCLSVLMCRWRVWEFFIEDALYKFTFWLIDWLLSIFRRKKSSVFWAQIWRFFGINRGLILNLSFITPKRHILEWFHV